ncbi:hypothetical protein EW146_g4186 [Bondarzewia mesenterica]|uniref:Uncharacterized protein n=1 Tax=Bondarzewia mesenterica TaxID=1095465 RepID=A0A4S4LX57_9AGAM|nr:hypothetical protein EW146_g4186 [Bondarzewia mesenterica]
MHREQGVNVRSMGILVKPDNPLNPESSHNPIFSELKQSPSQILILILIMKTIMFLSNSLAIGDFAFETTWIWLVMNSYVKHLACT